jgi:UDP-galactopyranose mutase
MFENIYDHPRISLNLNVSFDASMECQYVHVFNSMSIDEYFDYKYGQLQYRSVRFHNFTIPIPSVLPTATVNFTHTEPYTRVTEWKKFPNANESAGFTTLTVEEPCSYLENGSERYYPVKDVNGENARLYQAYKKEVPEFMSFIGRCGQYAYIDMHQAVSSALAASNKFLKNSGF